MKNLYFPTIKNKVYLKTFIFVVLNYNIRFNYLYIDCYEKN